jgi:hypothetical protein
LQFKDTPGKNLVRPTSQPIQVWFGTPEIPVTWEA